VLYILLGLACWVVFNLGFLLGCWWAGRKRSGVRERATDYEYGIGRTWGEPFSDLKPHVLPPVKREQIWVRIKHRLAVERLLRSL
jgi:hypothetical protein